MSQWRREASDRLPELQSVIASSTVNSPAQLWIELRFRFDELCHQEAPPVDLLSRIWNYAKWCVGQRDGAVEWAVTSHFFEHIEDTRRLREVLPKFMSQQEYAQFTAIARLKGGDSDV
jgi:hypothetical protein